MKSSVVWILALVLLWSVQLPGANIPFVGCVSDGQVGSVAPPNGSALNVPVPAEMAAKLAYYKTAQGLAAIAPRGWHCFGVYGSGGASL